MAKTVALDTKGQHLLNLDEARRNIASLVGEPGAEDVPAEEAADFGPEAGGRAEFGSEAPRA